MSVVPLPPVAHEQRALCEYLLSIPEFLGFLSRPDSFPYPVLVQICRTLQDIDPRFDARLAGSLFAEAGPDAATVLRVLSVLDEISPGARLNFVLTRLLRDAPAAVASKVALLFARRVYNPRWVERQLNSDDARLRANVIESLWGSARPQARAWLVAALDDPNNRVVGNALFGLHLLRDHRAFPGLCGMLAHPSPAFRATAAWAMGRTADRRYVELLERALADPEPTVRAAVGRALAAFQPPPAGCPAARSTS